MRTEQPKSVGHRGNVLRGKCIALHGYLKNKGSADSIGSSARCCRREGNRVCLRSCGDRNVLDSEATEVAHSILVQCKKGGGTRKSPNKLPNFTPKELEKEQSPE